MEKVETIKVRLLKAGAPNVTKFVLGATGSGKTTLIANLICECPRFLAFDTRAEYSCEFFEKDCLIVGTSNELADALNSGRNRIIFRVPAGVEEADATLEAALLTVYEFQRLNCTGDLGPITVCLDELNRFASTHQCPFALAEIIQRGRDYKIQKIFGAQWFSTIPTWIRDSFSELYVFRHTDKAGLILLENYGFEREEVRELPPYTCLYSGKNGIQRIKIVSSECATSLET